MADTDESKTLQDNLDAITKLVQQARDPLLYSGQLRAALEALINTGRGVEALLPQS